ncbi:MAG TPA: class I SAM-dependent methyltransferase [Burkholderiaceae bacterium]|jgi:cyclopropane fatty-acyl-phospholipid synthase-like methyltransferase|nr:class I SAM-dependent methyltransferase [Burkholderiaceae bacterium]
MKREVSLAVSGPAATRDGYDRIAERFDARRVLDAERRYVGWFVGQLHVGQSVLDVGCGSGRPIGAYLVSIGLDVTGVDVSHAMIELARRVVPGTQLHCADIRTVLLPRRFDAILAWDSLFHVPREDHLAVLQRFAGWIQPGGPLLLSLGGSSWEGMAPMMGSQLFYSSFAPERSLQLVSAAGFDVVQYELESGDSRGRLVVMARRR